MTTISSPPTSHSLNYPLTRARSESGVQSGAGAPVVPTQSQQSQQNQTQHERTTSPSPSAANISFTSKISALGARIGRSLVISSNGEERSKSSPSPLYERRRMSGAGIGYGYAGYGGQGEETDSVSEILYTKERSASRGREAFQSTGRGGLGNIRQASLSRDPAHRPATGPDDFSVTRGREPVVQRDTQAVFSTGRGGAGNLRSPSRPAAADRERLEAAEREEKEVLREYAAQHEGAVHSSGRGGLGNINRSRSRDPTSPTTRNAHSASRSPAPVGRFSTGRGGAGNILSGDGGAAEALDEDERRKLGGVGGGEDVIHSTGRGGTANLTHTHEPPVERHIPRDAPEYESTGRGGAGNIVRERERSRSRARA